MLPRHPTFFWGATRPHPRQAGGRRPAGAGLPRHKRCQFFRESGGRPTRRFRAATASKSRNRTSRFVTVLSRRPDGPGTVPEPDTRGFGALFLTFVRRRSMILFSMDGITAGGFSVLNPKT